MVAGMKFHCPSCGEDSIAKVKRKMSGFQCTGEVLVCMLCGAEIPEEKTDSTRQKNSNAASERLSALLGVKDDVPERLSDTPGTGFCRDCRNYIKHPFLSRCDKHNREVEPMSGCPDFQKAVSPGKDVPEKKPC